MFYVDIHLDRCHVDVDNLKNSVLLSFVETSRYYFFSDSAFSDILYFQTKPGRQKKPAEEETNNRGKVELRIFFVFYIYFVVLHIMH